MDEKQPKYNKCDYEAAEPWPGAVPELNYWQFSRGRSVMTTAQADYYKYFRDNTLSGRRVDIPDAGYSYVSVLKDELVQRFNSRRISDRAGVVEQAALLRKMYNYRGSDLDDILMSAKDLQRNRRLARLLKAPVAEWVPYGAERRVAGRALTRGGYYLGTHLMLHSFGRDGMSFSQRCHPVEGPVIVPDLATDPTRVALASDSYSTFIEMNDIDRASLVGWLEGDAAITAGAAMYYIAGWEFRLLGDTSTTVDDRIAMVRDLRQMYDSRAFGHGIEADRVYKMMLNLIDFAAARFFGEEAVHLFPWMRVEYMPKLTFGIIRNVVARQCADDASEARMSEAIAAALPVPVDLPEVYHDVFRRRLRRQLDYFLNFRGRVEWQSDYDLVYQPVGRIFGYLPCESIVSVFKISIVGSKYKESKLVINAKVAYNSLLSEISRLLWVARNEGGVIAMISVMPSWCDPNLLPGIEDAIEQLAPEPGATYRMHPARRLLGKLGFAANDEGDGQLDYFEVVRRRLTNFGLDTIDVDVIDVQPRLDDEIPVFASGYEDLPTRGTFAGSLYLLAWMLQAGEVAESDYAVADRWIDEFDPKACWQVPAHAALRWLVNHKLTMSAKRKRKAAALAKTVKRCRAFADMLLQLVSDPTKATPKRMTRLATIYTLLGYDPETIHADIHRLTTGEAAGKKGARKISKSVLRQMKENTEKAQDVLAEVFADETQPENAPTHAARKKSEAKTSPVSKRRGGDVVAGLLAKLAQKAEWQRDEFDDLCRLAGLTPGAALERINDLAYESLDEGVADDDGDTIYIDTDIASQLLKAKD